jgi:hypothetical protein
MNLEKAELKIMVVTDIGASMDDSLEAAKKDMHRQEGAVTSFGQAAKACELLCEQVNKDLDEGKISLEQAELVKLWLARAANAQRNLGRGAENLGMSASGKVSALEGAVALIDRYRRAEQLKIAEARAINPVSPETVELPGTRPGLSIKERRLLEEKAEAEAAAQAEPAPSLIMLSTPKRRGRPPNKSRN